MPADPLSEVPRARGRMLRLEQRVARWLERRRMERLMARFGGIQRCPWCRQCAQNGDGWSFDICEDDPVHDVLTCGVCGGTSLWHFAIGFIAVRPLAPPSPDPSFPGHGSTSGPTPTGGLLDA